MSEAGYRALPHTADLRIEAWGPTRAECLRQAALGLVASFADVSGAPASDPMPFAIEPGPGTEQLVALLDELIYVVDVFGVVPVNVAVEETEAGGVVGIFDVAPGDTVETTGALPKAVSRNDLACERGKDRWVARVTIDT